MRTIFFSILLASISHPIFAEDHQSQLVRPKELDPMATYQSCTKNIETLVDKLDCKVPPVLYVPGFTGKRNFEFGVQFYAARNGVSFERLNSLINLTQTVEGKKALVHLFNGLKCAGLPGDPILRKNWRSYLPACPSKSPKSPPWYKDGKFATATYHPGAHKCFRLGAARPKDCKPNLKMWECVGSSEWFSQLHPTIREILKEHGPSQQCCYDADSDLITEGASAGTPDIVSKAQPLEDLVEYHILSEASRSIKLEDLEKQLEKNKQSAEETEASIDHHIIDARIISACFPGWPGEKNEHVKVYHALGWTPYRP